MFKFLSSVGLSSIIDRKIKFSKLLKEASANPDFNFTSRPDKNGRAKAECYKYLGEGFGIVVYGEIYDKVNRKGENVNRFEIADWSLFALSDSPVTVTDFYVDKEEDGWTYAFCEEEWSGNLFEFKMNNPFQYEKRRKKPAITSVNVAMLGLFGTIILPVYKDDYSVEYRNEENKANKELLARARSGDNAAGEQLNQKAAKMAQSVWERMKSEDLLSIFEGYFLLIGSRSGYFSILADIEQVSHLKNNVSGETVVKLLLNITGTKINVFLNEKDLVGMPIVGMRFMGVGLLQGTAVM